MPTIERKQFKPNWVKKSPKKKGSWGYDTKFYARKAWRNLRFSFLMEHPLCVRCKEEGNLVTATVVDHIIPRKDRPDLELEWSNLQALCESCHNSKSGREGRGGQNPKNQSPANRCGDQFFYACKTPDLNSDQS